MASKALPSPEVLRQLLRYEPETGKLFWRQRSPEWFQSARSCAVWNAKYAGREAFTSLDRSGYRQGNILNHVHRGHRVVWAIVTGAWPDGEIDHVDLVRHNNRQDNLRSASRSENLRNAGLSKRNTSGFKGVSWARRDKKWRAEIALNGRTKVLGMFATPEEASAAYAKASAELHGEFGRVA